MTRKHFVVLASIIASAPEHFRSVTAHATYACETAQRLAHENGRFDRDRFLAAAMPTHYVGTRHADAWDRACARFTDRYGR